MDEENTLAAEVAQAAEPVAAPEKIEAPEVSETPEAPEPAAEPAGEKDDRDKRNRRSAQERIAQLTRQKRERDEEIERLKALVATPPKEADFTDYAEYERARAKHAAREALVEDRTELAKSDEQQITRALQEDWQAKVSDFKATAPDFEAVVYHKDVPISPPMAQVLMAMDDGVALAYHLAKNPHEAARLASLHPVSAAAEMGRMAERLKAPPRRVVSSAPPPVSPVVGGGGPVSKSPAEMSQSEYNAWRRGQK